ncbi:D-inositol 3-phosphate glycosyltransferase [Frankia sp. AiPs1]|uniref:D-inositol-3-phosphate glycosyltransferase n=1 Tax=Frankia sp. AiPa1 TaxID=573492 RepID=UPI00202AC691|nr:D-inositol-3-phosphate glycosyltransferase [Frankia sp. AiPa1]MCL9759911.1 D-inositol-3-phosphate glycosyltransferase [Frankia sp. AiPa1]
MRLIRVESGRSARPRRVAMLSMHTSPLEQPGTGDAGGLNVYVVELSRQLAALGVEVEIFTRAVSSRVPAAAQLAPGVTVRHVDAGPFEEVRREDLPAWLCAFTADVLRAEAGHDPGWFDLIHSHYWLSGQVARAAARRWGVPFVHTSHTLAKVKNDALAAGDRPEPAGRLRGEQEVVADATRMIASTAEERGHLIGLYGALPERVDVVAPGVDLTVFRPGEGPRSPARSRARLGLDPDGELLLFVGRIQPLKAPDVLLHATAELLRRDPTRRSRLSVAVVGGPSGTGLEQPDALVKLAADLGISDLVRFQPPAPQRELVHWYRSADAVVVPSHSESFGLVALEAQACGTPVIAAAVGGLRTAVADGVSGLLVPGHDPLRYADALDRLLRQPRLRARLAGGAVDRATGFGWSATARGVLRSYRHALSPAAVAV